MNVNFAVSDPAQWVKKSLAARASSILSPGISKWSTQRTPWARVLSNAIIDGNATLRNEYALWSGILDSFESSYDITNKTLRPKAGVTSIEVDFKGTMGSTRSCIINFQCWTLEDLQVLEKLYMIPGMSIIVEWGWSLDTNGNSVGPLNGFTKAPSTNPHYMVDIMNQILKYRESFLGNYDGLVGIVTNFNYTLNEQLGFDCSIELTSPGEMWLEQNSTNTSRGCTTNDNNKQKKQSNLEKVFHKLYTDIGKKEVYLNAYNTAGLPKLIKQTWETETREYDKQYRTGISDTVEDLAGAAINNTARENDEVYISWSTFVRILNDNINLYVHLKEDGSVSAEPDPELQYSNPKLGNSLIPITILPKMLSLDPRVCTFKPLNINPEKGKTRADILAMEEASTDSEINKDQNSFFYAVDAITSAASRAVTETVTKVSNYARAAVTPTDINPTYPEIPNLDDVEIAKKQILDQGDSIDKKNLKENNSFKPDPYVGLLNNVYLNAGYLRDCIGSGEEINMQDLLSTILSDLNLAAGGLWDLQYHVDEKDPSRLQIYDANYTSDISRKNTVTPYTFEISRSLVRKANVESKLVDGFKSMVLYGNADDNGNDNPNHIGSKLYGEGVVDGFKGTGVDEHIKGCPDTKPAQDGIIQELDLDAAYYILREAVDDESVSNAKNSMKMYIGYLNKFRKDISVHLPRNQNILLPFNFSLDMDGFSGLVWGNAIRFDYLPKRYDSAVHFQIIKVKHTINNTDWITNIETIMRLVNTQKAENTYSQNPIQFSNSNSAAKSSNLEASKLVANSGKK